MTNLLLDEYPLIVLPTLATRVGLNEAIVLQQIHYWLKINEKSHRNFRDGRWWCYNTLEQWQEKNFPFWSIRTIRRIFTSLENKKLIYRTDEYNTASNNRTLWCSIRYDSLQMDSVDSMDSMDGVDNLTASSRTKWQDGGGQNDRLSLTETNTEDNTESFIAFGDPSQLLGEYPTFGDPYTEARYVDDDEIWPEDEKRPSKKSLQPKTDLEQRALDACGRKYFQGKEAGTFRMIVKSAVPWEIQTKDAKMHIEWIERCIDWAKKKNLTYQKERLTRAVMIKFPQLLSFIQDEDKHLEWVSDLCKEYI